MNPSVSATEEDEYSRYVEHPLNLPLVVSSEMPSADDPSTQEFYDYLSMTEGGIQAPKDFEEDGVRITLADLPRVDTDIASLRSFTSHNRPMTSQSISTPFSHAPSYSYPQAYIPHMHQYSDLTPATSTSPAKLQTAEEDIEDFEEFLRVRENPLDVEEDDGNKKRYKAYRQWLRGKSFFKQSKVDPEWQNQLPVR